MNFVLLNDEYLLSASNGRLHHLATNEIIQLRSNEWKLLTLMVSRPGEDITTEEILNHVWAQTRSKSNVATTIKKLRQLLGDNADNPRYIQTQVMKGYVFVGEVSHLSEKDAQDRLNKQTTLFHTAFKKAKQYQRGISLIALNVIAVTTIVSSLSSLYRHGAFNYEVNHVTDTRIIPLQFLPDGYVPTEDEKAWCYKEAKSMSDQLLINALPALDPDNSLPANADQSAIYWTTKRKEALTCYIVSN